MCGLTRSSAPPGEADLPPEFEFGFGSEASFRRSASKLPVYPDKPTIQGPAPTSQSGQIRKSFRTVGRGEIPCRDFERLLKCDFGEASKLARMQALRFLEFKGLERLQADLKMLADSLPIEVACHTGELDFTVKGFIRDA